MSATELVFDAYIQYREYVGFVKGIAAAFITFSQYREDGLFSFFASCSGMDREI